MYSLKLADYRCRLPGFDGSVLLFKARRMSLPELRVQ